MNVADSTKKVFIRFDGIYMNSKVWINGHLLGLRPYGYVGFQYDITGFLKFSKDSVNVLAVQVDNSLQPASRWYSGSGIYRNVWLVITNSLHFTSDGVFVHCTEADSSKATISVAYKIRANVFSESKIGGYESHPELEKRTTKECSVISTVRNKEGQIVAKGISKFSISDLTMRETHTSLEISNPNLWSSESPVMYQLQSSIECDGVLIDQISIPIGIRKLEYTVDNGLLVNGKPIKLKGVCLHHDGASFGAAVPIGVWEMRLKQFKTMGCNAIRTSHYPFAPEFLDLCDQMGFYIMEDTFDEWRYGYQPGFSEDPTGKREYTYHIYFDQWAETDLREMIENDRNHPSIVMYCLGNEVVDQKFEEGVKTLNRLKNIAHECDPTRLTTVACDFSGFANRNGFMDAQDIAGYNYADRYHGEDMYTPDKEKYPNRMFIGTETYTNPRCWVGIKDKPWVMGEFLWAGIDYLGEAWKWPNRSITCSLFDLAGLKMPIYYNRKSFWTDEPIVYLAVQPDSLKPNDWKAYESYAHWNWEHDTRDSLTVYAFSNCEKVKLTLNDRPIGTFIPDKYHVVTTKIKFRPGTLKAVGVNNNKMVTIHELKTAKEAVSLNLKKCNETTTSNQKLMQVEIDAVDKNGNVVFADISEVTITMKGSGKLIGLDTADPNSQELYKTDHRRLFQGKAMATILIEGDGIISVVASSPKLKTGEITMNSK
jgi:beta-galactosidase